MVRPCDCSADTPQHVARVRCDWTPFDHLFEPGFAFYGSVAARDLALSWDAHRTPSTQFLASLSPSPAHHTIQITQPRRPTLVHRVINVLTYQLVLTFCWQYYIAPIPARKCALHDSVLGHGSKYC